MSGALEPLTLTEVKGNLRVDTADDDDAIGDLISDAREFVESQTGLVLVPRTVTETAGGLGRWIDLRSWPVTSVAAIRYPLAGTMTALPAAAWIYSTKRRPVRLLPASFGWGVGAAWPWAPQPTLPVEIDVVAGYATPGDVPRVVKRAMQLLISHWYANRDAAEVGQRAAAIELPMGVRDLLRDLKRKLL